MPLRSQTSINGQSSSRHFHLRNSCSFGDSSKNLKPEQSLWLLGRMRYSHFALCHSLGLKNAYQNWSKQVKEATVIVQLRGNRITQESTDILICTPSGPEGHTKATKESSVSPWRAKAHFWQPSIMNWILQGLPQKPRTALCKKGAVRGD